MNEKQQEGKADTAAGRKFRSVKAAVCWFADFQLKGGRSISIPTIIPKKGGSTFSGSFYDFNGDVSIGEQSAVSLRIYSAIVSSISCGYISKKQVLKILIVADEFARFIESETLFNASNTNKNLSKTKKDIEEKRHLIRLSNRQMAAARKVYKFKGTPKFSPALEMMLSQECRKMKFSFMDFGLLREC